MAYEIACILTELGKKVDLLAVIDVGPVQSGHKPKFGDRLRYLAQVLRNLPFWARDERAPVVRALSSNAVIFSFILVFGSGLE